MRPRPGLVAAVMAIEAASLAVMSALHLAGVLLGRSNPFDPRDAGIAEAVIGVALAGGAIAALRESRRARDLALASTIFAIIGFIIGLNFTLRGGDAIDIAYHATVLPLLVLTGSLLLLRQSTSRRRTRRTFTAHPS